MAPSIIVILVLITPALCDNITWDYFLFRHGLGYNDLYVKTDKIVNERPEYKEYNDTKFKEKIFFKGNQWVMTDNSCGGHRHCSGVFNNNTQTGPTPPKHGWGSSQSNDLVVDVVNKTSPPLAIFIQGESKPVLAGLYYLSNSSYNGYPSYYNSQGHIIQVYEQHEKFYWYWKNHTGERMKLSKLSSKMPPTYTPAGWDGWDGWNVTELENKTVLLSNKKFCATEEGGYFVNQSDSIFL